ncbi:MAG: Gfo/Idh/MocA family oxidoreductase [Clostridiales bacterium]|nr:Gfo/Idh/MocA family oxidoreductase [Clostridiales bacterium]
MKIKIAMAGLAHAHGLSFLEDALKFGGVELVGFYDEDREKALEASKQFAAPLYESLDSLLEESGANTFLTAAINNERAAIIAKAIDKGLNIIADKPLATTLEDLEKIERALERNKSVKLYLMLTERYNPVLVTARKLIQAGEIGRLANIINMRPHRLKPENRPGWMFDSEKYGGILNDIGVHDIDIACWVAQSEVKSVLAANASNLRFKDYTDFDDVGSAMLLLEEGTTVFILESWFTPDQYPHHGEMKFIFHGTNGQIIADPQNKRVTMYSDTKALHDVEIIEPHENYVSDPLKYFSQKGYKPVIDTKESIQAQKNALICQALAKNE